MKARLFFRFVLFTERYGYMSKKAVIIVAVLSIFFIGTIVIVSMNFKLMSTTASDKFWEFLAEQFEKEEKAREETKYGGIGQRHYSIFGRRQISHR